MKLLIIVICMLFERYGERFERVRCFDWFYKWEGFLKTNLSLRSPLLLLPIVLLPVILILWFVHFIVENWIWGSVGLVFQCVIFFFCLGPENLFISDKQSTTFDATVYFEKANRQWFGVMFWYVLVGIWGAVIYRLLDIASKQGALVSISSRLIQYLDWIPARLTALLYLLVGHFQEAYSFLLKNFWSGVEQNQAILSGCGVKALSSHKKDKVEVEAAHQLVWRALILFLVGIALMTLIAWL